ncbi:hypothetical protein BT93_L2340 [Corymbia citriodora subsp. variegata]|uniref:BHLH domain-containing protein n=1 Tax=Corymbia citriodora subsp. variegata TaxID=360336 RepID=A0A8T0CJV9_CORYI|nr:hypothetical protein BT93_L2340 [Corymbia citriodora subsp. variegata]
MANNPNDGPNDEFFEHLLGLPNFAAAAEAGLAPGDGSGLTVTAATPMMLQLGSGDGSGGHGHMSALGGGGGGGGAGGAAAGGGGYHGTVFPLGLSLEQGKGGFLKPEEASGSGKRFHEEVVDGRASTVKNVFHGQPVPILFLQHHIHQQCARESSKEIGSFLPLNDHLFQLRRERIAERIRQLQDLVPSVNKTDRAAMLDEIVDYVKFLRLQVKVLSMSRLGAAGAVAPLVTDIPLSSVEEEGGEGGRNQPAWEKWSNDGTERQVAKLMEENVGTAMQFLQSKALCIMPISLATAIYQTQPPDTSSLVKSESNPPS